MGKVNVAIAGVGNCASSLVQGIEYYKDAREDQLVPGLMHVNFGGYHVRDVKFVAAFDVDANKVGKDLSDAIFTKPNCTVKFSDVPELGIEVMRGELADGIGKYLKGVIPVDKTAEPVDVGKVLEETDADLLVNYMPVGSYKASRYYAEQALKAGCGFVNCIPEFIVSDRGWGKRFGDAGFPCAGDDIKSQVGATILHRALALLLLDRGVKLDESYQLNVGGNSVTGDQEILIEVDGTVNKVKIGEFIDTLVEKHGFELRGDKEVLDTTKALPRRVRCFTVNDENKVVLAPVTKLIRHKIDEPIFEVVFTEGHRIKITGDHNVFTLGNDGEFGPIPVDQLKIGETFIVAPKKITSNQAGKDSLNLSPFLKDLHAEIADGGEYLSVHGHPEIKIPLEFPLSDELLSLVGLWLADGSFDRKRSSNIELAVGNDPFCMHLIKRFAEQFNLSYRRRGKGGVAVRINSKILGAIMRKILNMSGDATTKRVPGWIFGLSEDQISSVLKGYISGDGCVIGKQVRWTSVSRPLIDDIQTLLLRVGIYSTYFRENSEPSKNSFSKENAEFWHGIISSRSELTKFVEKIGFLQRPKNEQVRETIAQRMFDKSFIPKISLIGKAGIKPTTTYKLPAVEKRIILAQLGKVRDEKVRRKLERICSDDIKFIKVKEIKKLPAKPRYVYDLSVKPYERFICSNILVHNTDFLNMLEEERLSSKRVSKTEAVASQIPYEVPLKIGPSDYIPFLNDNKICYINMRGRKFGDIPLSIDVKLSVEDSPNSAGVVIDAIRAVKLGLDRGVGGPLTSISAYCFKHPPTQIPDSEAKRAVEEFIAGERER